jgi:hypothetical protein
LDEEKEDADISFSEWLKNIITETDDESRSNEIERLQKYLQEKLNKSVEL